MKNPLKEKLAMGTACLGGWLTTASPEVAEMLAMSGFDWVAVDMEHNPISESAFASLFPAIERHGAAPMVRLPSADPNLARRALDAGAAGLLIPAVEDAEAFAVFAAHCIYPPSGRRGVCLARMNRWGKDFDGYMRDFEPVIVPQIETRRGVENAAAIAALDVVDALFIGPYDLSADMGMPGRFDDPAFTDMLDRIRAACEKGGAAPGIHQVALDRGALAQALKDGYRFVAYGTDMLAIRDAFGGIGETGA